MLAEEEDIPTNRDVKPLSVDLKTLIDAKIVKTYKQRVIRQNIAGALFDNKVVSYFSKWEEDKQVVKDAQEESDGSANGANSMIKTLKNQLAENRLKVLQHRQKKNGIPYTDFQRSPNAKI